MCSGDTLGFEADDLEATVDALRANGVTLEEYDIVCVHHALT